MKHKMMYAIAVAALTGMAAWTVASVPAEAKSGKVCKALLAVDPDADGKLDLAEAKKAASATFDRLNKDKNKDSTLDAKELRGRLSAKELRAADPDKDKTLDKAEYLAVVEARFKAANRDKDDTIECKELGTSAGQALYRLLK
jgi:Ca2+-binding EF-hand superfamily protein